MKLYTTNATALLLERAETLEDEDRRHWRCIYLQLHDRPERLNETLRVNFISRPIVEMMQRDEGHIYFCDDGDIFVLFEGALKPLIAKLSAHFGDIDPDQLRGQAESTMFRFFDLSKHWEGFYALCQEKALRTIPTRERLPRLHVPQTDSRVSA